MSYVVLNKAFKCLVNISDWTAFEVEFTVDTYLHAISRQILDNWAEGDYINLVLSMNKYPFVINSSLFYKFVRALESRWNYSINGEGYDVSTNDKISTRFGYIWLFCSPRLKEILEVL